MLAGDLITFASFHSTNSFSRNWNTEMASWISCKVSSAKIISLNRYFGLSTSEPTAAGAFWSSTFCGSSLGGSRLLIGVGSIGMACLPPLVLFRAPHALTAICFR